MKQQSRAKSMHLPADPTFDGDYSEDDQVPVGGHSAKSAVVQAPEPVTSASAAFEATATALEASGLRLPASGTIGSNGNASPPSVQSNDLPANGECCSVLHNAGTHSLNATSADTSSNIYCSATSTAYGLSGGTVRVATGLTVLAYPRSAVGDSAALTVKAKFNLREVFFNQIKRGISSGVEKAKTAEARFGFRSHYPYLQVGDHLLFVYGCHATRASVTRVRVFLTMHNVLNEADLFVELFPDIYTAYLKVNPAPSAMRNVFRNTLLSEVMSTVSSPSLKLEHNADYGFIVLNVKVISDSDAERSCTLERWLGQQNTACGFIKEMQKRELCRGSGSVYDSMNLRGGN